MYVPLEAASQYSVIPGGGVNPAFTLQAPPKMSSVFARVVVIDGDVTFFELVVPLNCPFEALRGVEGFPPRTARMPPDMSWPAPLANVNV